MNLNSHNIDADGDNNPTGRSANNGKAAILVVAGT